MSKFTHGIFRSSTEVLTNVMRRILSLPLAVLLLAPAAVRAEEVNRIVLRVNDQIATLYDYQTRRRDLVRDVSRREIAEDEKRQLLSQVPEIVFRDLYQELLLESRAQQLGVEVTRNQVDTAIENMKKNFGIKSDDEFRAALAQSGLTEPQLRKQYEGQLRVREVMDREVRSRIKLEEEDLRRYYRKNIEQFRQPEQVHLREVVVLDAGGLATPEERARAAAEIRQAVVGGKPLADAVAELQQQGVTSNVIDLGWVTPGDLDPALETAAWKLPPNAVSEPVAGRGGLHLLQVVERRESRIPPFSEVANAIQEREAERVYEEEFTKYMAELEKRSLIVAKPPQEAANFHRLLSRPAAGGGLELSPATLPENAGAGSASAEASATATDPSRTAPADSVQGAPGALPEPKPVTTNPPPVVGQPSDIEPPPAEAPASPPPAS
jgi:peptidyl-prolyl cis-trans isomerase SurA